MGSPLGPTLANAFLCFYEKKWLEKCPPEFKPVFYRRYVDDIFVLFKSTDHLEKFRNYFNICRPNTSFSFEEERNGKMSFSDVEISRENDKFVTTVYRKPTFSGVYCCILTPLLRYSTPSTNQTAHSTRIIKFPRS